MDRVCPLADILTRTRDRRGLSIPVKRNIQGIVGLIG